MSHRDHFVKCYGLSFRCYKGYLGGLEHISVSRRLPHDAHTVAVDFSHT